MRQKGRTLLVVVNKLFVFKKFVDNTHQCVTFTPQANFPAHILNFHWRWGWWDWIRPIFLNLFYFTWYKSFESTQLTKFWPSATLEFLANLHCFYCQLSPFLWLVLSRKGGFIGPKLTTTVHYTINITKNVTE